MGETLSQLKVQEMDAEINDLVLENRLLKSRIDELECELHLAIKNKESLQVAIEEIYRISVEAYTII